MSFGEGRTRVGSIGSITEYVILYKVLGAQNPSSFREIKLANNGTSTKHMEYTVAVPDNKVFRCIVSKDSETNTIMENLGPFNLQPGWLYHITANGRTADSLPTCSNIDIYQNSDWLMP